VSGWMAKLKDSVKKTKDWIVKTKPYEIVVLLLAVLSAFVGSYVLVHYIIGQLHLAIEISTHNMWIVLFFSFLDLIFRLATFSDIQSVSLDIVIFSLVYRASISIANPSSLNTYLLLTMLGLFILGILVYKDFFVKYYQENLEAALWKIFENTDVKHKHVLEKVCRSYKHNDLWGIFRKGVWKSNDEIKEINDLLDACNLPESNRLTHSDCKLRLSLRFLIVFLLAFISFACIWVNGFVPVR
jgi:hypothetical protein